MMRMPGFELPDDGYFRAICFSGGRTSAMLAMRIAQANGGIPEDRAAVVFNNTGLEREETLAFVRDFEERTGIEVHWTEYRHNPNPREGGFVHDVARVDFESASRNGEPFAALNATAKALPHAKMRKCTEVLKVSATQWYLERHLGRPRKSVRNVIGIRHDEAERWKRLLGRETCTSDMPLVVQRIERADVDAFWAAQNFDLGIDSELSNCTLCFLKGKRHLLSVIRAEPHLADWWMGQERLIAKRSANDGTFATFNKDWSYAELKRLATQSNDMFAQTFAHVPEDDGEALDCLCTD